MPHGAILLLLALTVALTGCSAPAGAEAPPPDVIGEWELVSGAAAGATLPMPPAVLATLTFDGSVAGGRAFCNGYGSPYTLDGDALRFDALYASEVGCEPDVAAAESAYLAALGLVDTAARDSDELLLTGPEVHLRYRPVPPVPTSNLVGTEWVLETLLEDELASSTGGGPATLLLAEDGTMTGSTGCRELSGRWDVRGGAVVLPELRADGECPEDLRAQDDHVIAVLGNGFRAVVAENRLTVRDPDGSGLVYRAA